MVNRKFKVTRAEVGSFHTSFSVTDMDHANPANSMSADAFFHHIGGLVGRNLEAIEGLEFTVTLPGRIKVKKDDPLSMCGKTLRLPQPTQGE